MGKITIEQSQSLKPSRIRFLGFGIILLIICLLWTTRRSMMARSPHHSLPASNDGSSTMVFHYGQAIFEG